MPEALQQQLCPVAVWHTGGRDHHRQDQAEGIDEEVAFAALDLFVCVNAPDPVWSKNSNVCFPQRLRTCHHLLNVLISPLLCPILTRHRAPKD